VDDAIERLRTAIVRQLGARERTRRTLEEQLRYFDLRPRLRRDRERLNEASTDITAVLRLQMARRRQRFETLSTKLTQLDPRLVLSRGYAIVLNDAGHVVRKAADAPVRSEVKLVLAKDTLKAEVIP
jgi:exodeoxyribonuclease VII large subunit